MPVHSRLTTSVLAPPSGSLCEILTITPASVKWVIVVGLVQVVMELDLVSGRIQ